MNKGAWGLCITQMDTVLVLRRSVKIPHYGYWDFPGGMPEPGEKSVDTLIREFKEETGISLVFERGQNVETIEGYNGSHIYTTFILPMAMFIPRLSVEHIDYMWVPINQLLSINLLPQVAAVVEKFMRTR
jgi:8-oxo-dGTP pyrophosphatase MutT (NUDIX family)